MDANVKKDRVENTTLGSIKFHSAFFPMTRELFHLVLLTNCIEEKPKVHYSLPNIDR
jgi:hypothetical protein